jgi:hypothetical protein
MFKLTCRDFREANASIKCGFYSCFVGPTGGPPWSLLLKVGPINILYRKKECEGLQCNVRYNQL